jgi:hypothetical protein
MCVISRSGNRLPTGLLILFAAACSSFGQDRPPSPVTQPAVAGAQPPLEISFKELQGPGAKKGEVSCGMPEGRQQVYDPDTGIFHIHFKSRNYTVSAFELTKVAERFPKPRVFRLTGVPKGYGCLGVPLVLSVGERRYAIEEVALAPGPVDKTLFRVERNDEMVAVALTAKGQALLRPGARISFKVDTGW